MDKVNQQIAAYMRTHWPSEVKPEWQVTDAMYPEILEKIIKDFTVNATKSKQFFRICGQSGSGKTSQLLPAASAFFASRSERPILIAARLFVAYHPYSEQIKTAYGAEHLRTKTNEVSTILMFLTLRALISKGYDIILDVTLLDPLVEAALMQMLTEQNYQTRLAMVAVSKEISDAFIGKRKRKVAKSTAAEFWRATRHALDFYAQNHPEMPVIIWNAWDPAPVYDGRIGHPEAIKTIEKFWAITKLPQTPDTDALREAKIAYLTQPA